MQHTRVLYCIADLQPISWETPDILTRPRSQGTIQGASRK